MGGARPGIIYPIRGHYIILFKGAGGWGQDSASLSKISIFSSKAMFKAISWVVELRATFIDKIL